MADAKISALTELAATPAADDYLPIIDASEVTDGSKNKRITVDNLFSYNDAIVFTPLTTPLTSTAWIGAAHSTTAKTLIDLSAVFGAPAGIKAVLVRMFANDSASVSTSSCWIGLSPNDEDKSLALVLRLSGVSNDMLQDEQGICPCDEDGDIYYQIIASGSGTMGVTIQIWGYWL